MNAAITAPELLLIDTDGEKLGVVSREQAFFFAAEAGLDIVEVSGGATPPVVRLLDYNKQRYEDEKRARKSRAKQKAGETKEIKLSFKISEHDFQTKLRRAQEMLSKGDRIKLFMRLIGRENAFADLAKERLQRFATDLGATIESLDKQGPRITAILK